MKVLLISDKKNWSYAAIAQALIKFNTTDLHLKHVPCKGKIEKIARMQKRYDVYFVLGWQNAKSLPFLDKKRTLVGIHSHQSFDNQQTKVSKDISPPPKLIKYLSQFRGVNTVSERLYGLLKKSGLKCTYTPNGVDTTIFRPGPRSKTFTVSCVAAPKNDWNKGVRKIIIPACRNKKVRFLNHGTNNTTNSDMAKFYNRSHCYVCASRSEGMPMSILEAAACGCVIVSTPCGDIVNLIQDEQNGFLVQREISDIARVLGQLKRNPDLWKRMSSNVRKTIEDGWSWKLNAPKWIDFIRDTS